MDPFRFFIDQVNDKYPRVANNPITGLRQRARAAGNDKMILSDKETSIIEDILRMAQLSAKPSDYERQS